MLLKNLILTLLFAATSAHASSVIRIDSKNDLIKQIAVTADESVYGVGSDQKLYVSHNQGAEWTAVESMSKSVDSVKVALTGEVFVTTSAGQTLTSSDLKSWKEISSFSGKGMVVLPTGKAFDIRPPRDSYQSGYEVVLLGPKLPTPTLSVTSLDVFGSNDQTLCEVTLISGKNYSESNFGNIVCQQNRLSWSFPGAYLKAAITADGETLVGLKQDGSIEKITIKDTRFKEENTHSYEPKVLTEAEITREMISDSTELYRNVTTGVFGRVYGLTTLRYPHLSAKQLVFQHVVEANGEPVPIYSGLRLNTQMRFMRFGDYGTTIMNGTCKVSVNEKSKRYEVVCSDEDGYRSFNFTAINQHAFDFSVIEKNKVIAHGVADLN